MASLSSEGVWLPPASAVLPSPAEAAHELRTAAQTQAEPRAQNGKHITALDGLRGVAILYVMLYHFSGGYKGHNLVLRAWSAIADSGWMGVDLFFVLSGFLITGILYDTAHAKNRMRNFYARRALRIFPLFYAVLGACLLLTPLLHLQWHAGHLLYFVYLGNMTSVLTPHLPPVQPWLNLGHLWSLAVEEQFYLLWPFAVWWVRDRRWLLRISGAILLLEPALRFALLRHGTDAFTLGRLLFTRADSLFFGAALALLVRGPGAHRLPVKGVLVAATATLAALLVWAHGPVQESLPMVTLGYSAVATVAACLVYLAQMPNSALSVLLDHATLRFFGKYSYGLYIFHGVYFVYLRHLSGALERRIHSGMLAQLLDFVFGFGISVALAVISFHLFEEPILRLKRRFA